MKFYEAIAKYSRQEMNGVAHGWEHVLRVKKNAAIIASDCREVNMEVLMYAVLLHDIGRKEKGHDHAQSGAEKSQKYLRSIGMSESMIEAVVHGVRTHRYRGSRQPETIEAKILFDADKLDAIGMIGAARAIAHAAENGEPLFMDLLKAREENRHPANLEYEFKLKQIPQVMLTQKGKEMASERMDHMKMFFDVLSQECDE